MAVTLSPDHPRGDIPGGRTGRPFSAGSGGIDAASKSDAPETIPLDPRAGRRAPPDAREVLEDAGFELTVFVPDIFGVSVWAVLQAMIVDDPVHLLFSAGAGRRRTGLGGDLDRRPDLHRGPLAEAQVAGLPLLHDLLQVLSGEDEMPNGRSRRRLWCRDYERCDRRAILARPSQICRYEAVGTAPWARAPLLAAAAAPSRNLHPFLVCVRQGEKQGSQARWPPRSRSCFRCARSCAWCA